MKAKHEIKGKCEVASDYTAKITLNVTLDDFEDLRTYREELDRFEARLNGQTRLDDHEVKKESIAELEAEIELIDPEILNEVKE